jgi:arylsulfatase
VAPEAPEHAYHLSTDLADRAIRYLGELRSVDVKSPFFMYFAPGAGHAPHQAPGDWIAHYAGRFDDGWDAWRERAFLRQLDLGLFPETTVMVPRPHWIPAWESFDPDERLVSARLMECFAGFLSHADAQIGRVFDFIRTLGEWDKTLVIAVSDNGASGEGGPRGSINGRPARDAAPSDRADRLARMDEIGGPTAHNNYPWGWAMAGNTPFRRWKGEVHEGGVIAPAIVSWPSRLPGGGPPRRQFTHAIDILPTVLDLIGMEAPAEIGGVSQARIEGTSFASVLGDPEASEPHPIQYFEMMGSRAIYHQGWKAVTFHPFVDVYQEGRDPALPFDDDVWELYDLADDPTEAHDRARSDRERLDTMVDLWWTEAGKYQVLPLDNRLKGSPHPHSGQPPGPTQVIWPFGAPSPQSQVLDLRHRSHSLNASVVIPPGGAEGVLIALGTVLGGWSFHLLDGHLRYENRFVANGRDVIVSPERVAPGPRTLAWQFTADGTAGGHGVMLVDGYPVAEGRLEPVQSAGDDDETGGGEGYTAPHTFSGVLHWVVLGLEEDGRVRP